MNSTLKPICPIQFPKPTGWLASIRFRLSGDLEGHIASCPRCRRRLADWGRVELALKLILTQPHSLTLLQRANQKALKMLSHRERFSPKAEALRQVAACPNWILRNSRLLEKVLQTAACLAVACLLKVGLVSFFTDIHEEGQKAVHNYYAAHLGE